jgi:ABC-2 type transport system permease protein
MSAPALRAFTAIARRELLRLISQRGRLAATLVRPLVWLGIFAAGFRSVLGLSVLPPYQTYVLYEVYLVPGLMAMLLLFHGVQSSFAMVYDREVGSIRLLLAAPFPRWWLLTARLVANTVAVIPLVLVFLLVARFWDVRPPAWGYLACLPAVLLAGLMLGAFGLAISALVPRLENFAGVMNFVLFPVFFASTALYPAWRLDEVSPALGTISQLNPFSHAVELIRFALYLQFEPVSFLVCVIGTVSFTAVALVGYSPGNPGWGGRAAR